MCLVRPATCDSLVAGADARYDEIADRYDGVVEDDVADPATSALFDLIGDPEGLRILDFACGQGRVARQLARQGARATGIDISASLLEKARSRKQAAPFGIRYELIDTSSPAAFTADTFDGVV